MPSLTIKIPKRAGEEMPVADLTADRSKALNVAIQQIERSYGKGSIMRMGAGAERVVIDGKSYNLYPDRKS